MHFDGHGSLGEADAGGAGTTVGGRRGSGRSPLTFEGPGPRGLLTFEQPGGGAELVSAERVARVLAAAEVPLVVLNAYQSATIAAQVEAAVATRLLQEGARAVLAMAYSVYTVAAAEFMAAFYERLFAGDRVSEAVAAGRRQLAVLRPCQAGDRLVPLPRRQQPGQVLTKTPPLGQAEEEVIEPGRVPLQRLRRGRTRTASSHLHPPSKAVDSYHRPTTNPPRRQPTPPPDLTNYR
ncbi:CHAT domain-containing protein [Streptomyces sp. NBC_00659]